MTLAAAFAVNGQVTGSWSGQLKLTPQTKLTLVVNIPPDNAATLDSPDQGAYGLPLEILLNHNDSLAVAVPSIGFRYTAHLHGDALRGTMTQQGMTFPLTLRRKSDTTDSGNQPQTPEPPFPYTSEDVVFDGAAGARLAGTLTIPDNPAPCRPAVVMISGSGPQDRDETVMGHKPFAVIADRLARKGIASLRYDDRGIGGSTGPTDTLTTAGNIADARAALAWLRAHGKFGFTGVLGHSEGGRIAFALPADFIVAIGCPALRGDTLLADQNRAMLAAAGAPYDIARMYADAFLEVVNGTPADSAVARWDITPVTRQLADNLHKVGDSVKDPWLAHMLLDDPATDISACGSPVLALYGSRDTQVTADLNAPRMKALLPEADVRVMDGLNHLMQHCTTGAVSEYARITETFAPEAIDAIVDWILSVPLAE